MLSVDASQRSNNQYLYCIQFSSLKNNGIRYQIDGQGFRRNGMAHLYGNKVRLSIGDDFLSGLEFTFDCNMNITSCKISSRGNYNLTMSLAYFTKYADFAMPRSGTWVSGSALLEHSSNHLKIYSTKPLKMYMDQGTYGLIKNSGFKTNDESHIGVFFMRDGKRKLAYFGDGTRKIVAYFDFEQQAMSKFIEKYSINKTINIQR